MSSSLIHNFLKVKVPEATASLRHWMSLDGSTGVVKFPPSPLSPHKWHTGRTFGRETHWSFLLSFLFLCWSYHLESGVKTERLGQASNAALQLPLPFGFSFYFLSLTAVAGCTSGLPGEHGGMAR